jgi:pimeloyl-ACP methyl ester carboxylesterase
VRDAYQILDREASLSSAGVAPGADREPFDSEHAFQNARAEPVDFGWFNVGGLLSPLRQLSFWKMKDRACRFGETGGFTFLRDLQSTVTAQRDVRFHLIGHSFGCIVVSAILAGPDGHGTLVRPVDSVALLQGALSLWSYCTDIPVTPGQPGYFHSIIADQKVKGPIITTQSELDTAVGRFYPLGAGVRRQITFAPGELPKYGGLGTFGVRGLDAAVVDLDMLPVSTAYAFAPGKIYNLESSRFICEGSGASGAHSDIAKPEVAHAVWGAVRG